MATPPRAQFVDVAGYTDPGGFFKPVTTTRVTVYLAVPYAGSSYTTLATIRSAETGSGTPGNPFDATTGEINFWAAPGSYDIKIEDLGIPAKFSTKYVRWDAIPADKGLASTMITDSAVTTAAIATDGVDTSELANNSVTTAKIANANVTLAKLATNSVDSSKIIDGSIALGDLESSLVSVLAPTGSIIAYGGTSAPTGYLLCNGSEQPVATYTALDAIIGPNFGRTNGVGGVGTSHFRLPDLRGRVPVGQDSTSLRISSNKLISESGGVESVALTPSQTALRNHKHVTDGNMADFIGNSGTMSGFEISTFGTQTNQGVNWDTSTGNIEGGEQNGASHTNLQPYQIVNYIIKT